MPHMPQSLSHGSNAADVAFPTKFAVLKLKRTVRIKQNLRSMVVYPVHISYFQDIHPSQTKIYSTVQGLLQYKSSDGCGRTSDSFVFCNHDNHRGSSGSRTRLLDHWIVNAGDWGKLNDQRSLSCGSCDLPISFVSDLPTSMWPWICCMWISFGFFSPSEVSECIQKFNVTWFSKSKNGHIPKQAKSKIKEISVGPSGHKLGLEQDLLCKPFLRHGVALSEIKVSKD